MKNGVAYKKCVYCDHNEMITFNQPANMPVRRQFSKCMVATHFLVFFQDISGISRISLTIFKDIQYPNPRVFKDLASSIQGHSTTLLQGESCDTQTPFILFSMVRFCGKISERGKTSFLPLRGMIKIFDHAMESKFKDIQGYITGNMLFTRNPQDFQGNFQNSRKFKDVATMK